MIAADCRAPDCIWRTKSGGTPAELRELVGRIVAHCKAAHPRACREIRVVIHAAGEHCDHEQTA